MRLFGDAGQALLSQLKVGVVGAGGAGSLVNEYLSRLGVGPPRRRRSGTSGPDQSPAGRRRASQGCSTMANPPPDAWLHPLDRPPPSLQQSVHRSAGCACGEPGHYLRRSTRRHQRRVGARPPHRLRLRLPRSRHDASSPRD
ncbi:MAG: hypothetical protein M5U18_19515 [Dehalococcoidia bacterium]|nr:hypothetical protein [Dehalococcoidia bacterium]